MTKPKTRRGKRANAGLTMVTARLFTADVDALKRRAEATGVPWQTQLRALVHATVTGADRKVRIL